MKKLLTIGQVAARLGRSVDFVRQQTDEGELKAAPRGKGKYRYYTEVAIAAYEAKTQRHRPSPRAHPQPKRASPPPRPPRPIKPPVEPGSFADDEPFWTESLDVEPSAPPPPRAPSPIERVYLDTLITVGILRAPWGLPADWRGRLQADLEEYVTLERFPMADGPTSASAAIRRHVDAVLAPYHDGKRKEEDQKRAREAAARVAAERRQTLIDYGHQLVEHEVATWASDDPKDQARREIDLVLQAEVKSEWEERTVRELVQEQLDRYDVRDEEDEEEEEDEDDEEVEDGDDGDDELEDWGARIWST